MSDQIDLSKKRNRIILALGGSPIVPFESTMAVTSNGGSGTTVRTADA